MTRQYWLFGLRIETSLELPELVRASNRDAPDVLIREGSVPAAGTASGLVRHGDALLLVIPEVARFLIEGGARVTVEAHAGVPPRNVRLFLLGSAMGAVLHQRGLLPLHANAIEIGSEAIAFMGASGAGKSTLAAWFHDNGHRVIADDVLVIGPEGQGSGKRPTVRSGLPRLRLWREALEASGRNAEDYSASYIHETYDKFDIPLATACGPEATWPLACIYLLDRDDKFEIETLTGVAAAEALIANTYRGQFTQAAGTIVLHWSACVALARSTPIFRVVRRWGHDHFDTQVRALLEHAAQVIETEDGTSRGFLNLEHQQSGREGHW